MSHDDYWSLRRQVEEHPGFLYLESRRIHANSLAIYGGNFQELKALLSFVENPETYLRVKPQGEKHQKLFSDLHRFLHNYFVAAESLVSHTRNYVKHRHSADRIGEKYRKKVSEVFSNHVPTVLIKDFRNYFLHEGLPKSSIRETFNVDTREAPKIRVLLKVEELLKWKKWSSESKQFLRAQGNELQLSQLIAEYHNNVVAFYRWFDELLENEHRQQVEEMQSIAEKVVAIEKARG